MTLSENAIDMGNDPYSSKECYDRICKLISLFSDLSGIQQMGLMREEMNDIERGVLVEYLYEAKDFIKQLEKDLGLK